MVEIAQSLGAIAELRPAKLADDRTSLHMVTKYNLGRIRTKICEPKCIVQLAPTCPFLRESTLNKGIKKVLNENYTSAIGLQRIEHSHPYRARVLDGDGSFRNFIRDVDVEAPKFHSRLDLLNFGLLVEAYIFGIFRLWMKWMEVHLALGKDHMRSALMKLRQ